MRNCIVPDCPRPPRAHGMCTTHLRRIEKGTPLESPVRQYERDGICKVDQCIKSRSGHGDYCDMHLRRLQRRGDTGPAGRQRSVVGQAVWNDSDYSRHKKLRLEYGMSVDDYDQLLARQGGGCAICGSESAQSVRAKAQRSLCVDHDHVTGHVRGLLCVPCNRAIGLFDDDPAHLERAARYLRATRQIPLFGPEKVPALAT